MLSIATSNFEASYECAPLVGARRIVESEFHETVVFERRPRLP